MLAVLALACCLRIPLAAADDRAGIDRETAGGLVSETPADALEVRSLISAAGQAERAQQLKLRRHSQRVTGIQAVAKSVVSTDKKRAVKTADTVNTTPPATKRPAVAKPAKTVAGAQTKPQTTAKPKGESTTAERKAPAKKSAESETSRRVAVDGAVKPASASTHRSSRAEISKVVPAVKYDSAKAGHRQGSQPAVDVFSDPFGDEGNELTKRSSKPSTRRAVKAIEDDVNPFADDEPLERLVKRQVEEDSEIPKVPVIEEDLAQGPQPKLAPCPSPDSLKKIREIKADIRSTSTDLPPECTLGDEPFEPRQFAATMYHWKASALCHKPLYFEDVNLERYGHSWGPILQPLVSGAEFFVTLPVLPYKMGIEPPCECHYVLGYYRPGSCAPYMIFPVPLSIRGGLVEAGAVVGAVFLIP